MKKEKRFEIILDEGMGLSTKGFQILRDNETGVHYLFFINGYAGGLTPLLDKEGKPVVSLD
jgi:hypothetical protein